MTGRLEDFGKYRLVADIQIASPNGLAGLIHKVGGIAAGKRDRRHAQIGALGVDREMCRVKVERLAPIFGNALQFNKPIALPCCTALGQRHGTGIFPDPAKDERPKPQWRAMPCCNLHQLAMPEIDERGDGGEKIVDGFGHGDLQFQFAVMLHG